MAAAGKDPLFDTLFRPTTIEPQLTSSAPVREAGTRSRAGNAMGRTRAALLDGARRAVEVSGTKITMAQVAAAGGVAKATLYNHFRTREAVLAALLEDEVAGLTAALADRPLADALAAAANTLSEHPLLRALAHLEPATLTRLGTIDRAARGWQLAREGVDAALAAASRGGTDLVLRWLASFVLSPADAATIAEDLAILLVGLPDGPAAAPASAPADSSARTA
jgi:AcrR family transcriptional regulator